MLGLLIVTNLMELTINCNSHASPTPADPGLKRHTENGTTRKVWDLQTKDVEKEILTFERDT